MLNWKLKSQPYPNLERQGSSEICIPVLSQIVYQACVCLLRLILQNLAVLGTIN